MMKASEVVPLPEGVLIEVECPRCGGQDFQQEGMRSTWQPFDMGIEDGELTVTQRDVYETGDDTEEESYVCRSCLVAWPTMLALEIEMRYIAMMRYVQDTASNAVKAIERGTLDEWLEQAVAQEAMAEGARLDPRQLNRPDPEPFVRASLLNIVECLAIPGAVG